MKILNSLKSHKFFVFGLIFSFCLCFVRPVSSFAYEGSEGLPGTFRFGFRSASGVSDYFETDQPLNLFQAISGGADQVYPSLFNSSFFNSSIRTFGLESYFSNWDPYNPSFYCNVYCAGTSSYTEYYIDFRKSSFSEFDYSYDVFPDRVLVHNLDGFPSISSYVSGTGSLFLSLPFNYYLGFDSSYSDSFLAHLNGYYSSRSFSSGGNSYNSSSVSSSSVSTLFSDFLSNPNIYSFSLSFADSSGSLDFRGCWTNLGVNVRWSTFDTILSTFYVFPFDSVEFSSVSLSTYDYIVKYSVTSSDYYSIYDLSSPFTVGLSFTPNASGIPTPTPIPSPEWVTPTPLPTVTPVPISLTPIPQYINPDLDIDSTQVKSALSGYLDIIDDTFSNFAIFSLGSQVLSYLYSFSSYFSFVLLIPAICLIAYAIGRLNQK